MLTTVSSPRSVILNLHEFILHTDVLRSRYDVTFGQNRHQIVSILPCSRWAKPDSVKQGCSLLLALYGVWFHRIGNISIVTSHHHAVSGGGVRVSLETKRKYREEKWGQTASKVTVTKTLILIPYGPHPLQISKLEILDGLFFLFNLFF